ncbi:MAG: LacI family transcriptional regulator [Clostridiales bacterium]|nr:LacI family transcriptional regulator [Clostridiales bacterium]
MIKVIGFDDSILSKIVDPSFTVIKQPLKEIGEAAVTLLMNQLQGNLKPETIELQTGMVVRKSCGNPKERG